ATARPGSGLRFRSLSGRRTGDADHCDSDPNRKDPRQQRLCAPHASTLRSAPRTFRSRGALRAIKTILPLGSRSFLQVVSLGFAVAPLYNFAVRGPDSGLAPLDLADDRTQLEAQILGDSAPAQLLAAELFDFGEGLLRRHRSLGGSRQVLGHRQADGDFSPAHLLVTQFGDARFRHIELLGKRLYPGFIQLGRRWHAVEGRGLLLQGLLLGRRALSQYDSARAAHREHAANPRAQYHL